MKCAMDSVQQSVGILSQKVATLEQRTVPNQNQQVFNLPHNNPSTIGANVTFDVTSVGLTLLPVQPTQYYNHRRSALLGT